LNQPELIELLQRGDQPAFKKLVEEYQDMVYNTVVSMVQHEDAADDITQEVFIQVFQSISSFKGGAKISTWLYRIAVGKALDYERSRKRKKRFAFIQQLFGSEAGGAVHATDFQHPGILLEKKESAAALFAALKKIPGTQRAAFTLHKLEGLSYQEIAAVLDTTVAAVESLMGRARANLKKELAAVYKKDK
jgi:RNA polymerase sigma factor (sigma-70 family)